MTTLPSEVPEVDPEVDAERRRRIGIRVLLVLAVAVAGLMAVFGRTTSRSYKEFDAYQSATLKDPNNPPRWQVETLTVDECVDEVLDWIEACPGVSSWCEGSLLEVMNQCLVTADRSEYCDSVREETLSTRFGYHECAARYDQIDKHYARRSAKKHCAALYRVIAGHCAP